MKESSKVETYHVLGVMSGTSLDGLDLAMVKLQYEHQTWAFELLATDSIPYAEDWKQSIKLAFNKNKDTLEQLDRKFGEFIGTKSMELIVSSGSTPDFIASHGHTIFHQPDKGVTVQIGSASAINDISGIPVINDFRSMDVSLGGQGAPLVPMADRHLFGGFTYCLNLGGIANVSFESENGRIAFDICPINMVLNYLVEDKGLAFDEGGKLARSGQLDDSLFKALNAIPYCQAPAPKSLGYEDFLSDWKPLIDQAQITVEDKLRTVIEHCAYQIAKSIENTSPSDQATVLATGGGAFNDFFIKRLRHFLKVSVSVPSEEIIEFKEAIAFALLGVLRFRNEPNCLASVTGAKIDCSGGEMYGF